MSSNGTPSLNIATLSDTNVNSVGEGSQQYPAITGFSDGGYVVA
jgi:hypothetical protein